MNSPFVVLLADEEDHLLFVGTSRSVQMEISAVAVKELRQRTGAGVMDCKKALLECAGDMDEAIDFLPKRGWPRPRKRRRGRLQRVS